jgi:hypothetical protein
MPSLYLSTSVSGSTTSLSAIVSQPHVQQVPIERMMPDTVADGGYTISPLPGQRVHVDGLQPEKPGRVGPDEVP